MNRFILFLPVSLVGIPLLVYLLMDQSSDTTVLDENPVDTQVSNEDDLPNEGRMEQLAQKDQVTFLKNCIRRYQQEVQGYSLVMQKEERIKGKPRGKELVEVWLREKPHSVFMKWREGAFKAERVLWVEGENDGKMLVRPSKNLGLIARFVTIASRPVDGPEARQSGRFPLNKFGLKMTLERALASWQAAQKRQDRPPEFLGVERLAKADNQWCYHIRRIGAEPEGPEGILEQVLFIDKETWLPVGVVVRGKGGQLIGEYYFRQIRLNPEFEPGQFDQSVLTR